MQIRLIAIYSLTDPRCPKVVRYIGRAIRPQVRLDQHCNANDNSEKSRWVASLRKAGLKPMMEILDWVDERRCQGAERRFINRYMESALVNSTDNPNFVKKMPLPREVRLMRRHKIACRKARLMGLPEPRKQDFYPGQLVRKANAVKEWPNGA